MIDQLHRWGDMAACYLFAVAFALAHLLLVLGLFVLVFFPVPHPGIALAEWQLVLLMAGGVVISAVGAYVAYIGATNAKKHGCMLKLK